MESLDMSQILLEAYDLADSINQSEEVKRYLACKQKLEQDAEAQALIREFGKVKELFDEASRFGIFHPDYHEAKERALSFRNKLHSHPVIREFLEAEERLDELLNAVSLIIARSVSPSIKVPVNDGDGIKKARPSCRDLR
ncbi:YlbF family regulator [Staphylospora marina]|uniref:YlbF family regulator n=1 Tax=Staphylospora marina TaxID=2490858 RepID=UPI001F14F0A7|nr:YlbF family regulator [Staphylospora marina]